MVDFLKAKAENLASKVEEAGDFVKDLFSGICDDDKKPVSEGQGPIEYRPYRYTHDTGIAPWPMLETKEDGFPIDKIPKPEWVMKVVKVAISIAVNRILWKEQREGETRRAASAVSYQDVQLDLSHLGLGKMNGLAATVSDDSISQFGLSREMKGDKGMAELQAICKALLKRGVFDPIEVLAVIEQAIKSNPTGRPKSVEDYKNLFVTKPLPDLSENYDDDAIFTDLRVAGFNPVVIKQVSELPENFPVTDAMLSDATEDGDSLKAAGEDNRLFLADYAVLDEAEMGNYPAGPKYVFAPLALFALKRGAGTRKLVPVAIQCGQDPKEFPVHTPKDGTLWSRAKAAVQHADSNFHELVSHLSGCHLLMEPFAIATHNTLVKENHPIGHLLTPHFEGTLFINDGAVKFLLAPTAQVSQVLGPTIEASHEISVGSLLEENYFNKHMLPRNLRERGVMSEDLYYPYRDDALDLWHALRDWVESYVAIFYKDDAAVENDAALQAWAKQLVSDDGGRVRGFGEEDSDGVLVSGRLTTIDYLVDSITMVIFTASASHATFNFAQLQMTFAPAVPGAIYRSMPITSRQAGIMPELDLLPPLELARVQMEFLLLLGGVQHTQLGQYGRHWPQDDKVKTALEAFQARLGNVSETIGKRNETRDPPYSLLLPERIPQSINI